MRTDPGLRFSSGYQPQGVNLPGRHFQDGVSQSGKERNHLFLSTGEAFRDLAGISGADSIADGRALALTDFDRDGWTDIALVNANAPMFELYRNRMAESYGADPPGFVALELVGGNHAPTAAPGRSNRDGYGALVEAEVGGVTLLREHRAGEGMAAQNSSTMLIGLGDAKAAEKIVVRWPSGAVTRAKNVASGTLLTAYERPAETRDLFERSDYRARRRARGDADALGRSPSPRTLDPNAVEAAIDKAIGYFGREVRTTDPSWISLFGYLRRRFGVEVALASDEVADRVRSGVGRAEMYEIYRRIDDPTAAIDKQQIADLEHVVDRITASALHCDRIELPANWVEILGNATRAGGYATTHAVLATGWTVEHGCVAPAAVAQLREEQISRLHEMIDRRADLGRKFDTSTDLWIEAFAMLYYADGGSTARDAWVAALLAAQLDSGGWPNAPSLHRADPHTTALALWVLLENVRRPASGPWIVGPGPTVTHQ